MFVHYRTKESTDITGHEVKRFEARPRRDRRGVKRDADESAPVVMVRKRQA